jgi:hypothetical protein
VEAVAAPGHDELLQPGVPLQLQRPDALDAALVFRRPRNRRLVTTLLLGDDLLVLLGRIRR